MSDPQRKLAAIVAMDVAGYSCLMGRDEQGKLKKLMEHRAAVDRFRIEGEGHIVLIDHQEFHVDETGMRRMPDVKAATKTDQLERALSELGRKVAVDVIAA